MKREDDKKLIPGARLGMTRRAFQVMIAMLVLLLNEGRAAARRHLNVLAFSAPRWQPRRSFNGAGRSSGEEAHYAGRPSPPSSSSFWHDRYDEYHPPTQQQQPRQSSFSRQVQPPAPSSPPPSYQRDPIDARYRSGGVLDRPPPSQSPSQRRLPSSPMPISEPSSPMDNYAPPPPSPSKQQQQQQQRPPIPTKRQQASSPTPTPEQRQHLQQPKQQQQQQQQLQRPPMPTKRQRSSSSTSSPPRQRRQFSSSQERQRPKDGGGGEVNDASRISSAEMVEMQGVVKRITFANGETGFSVLKVERDEHNDLITVVGNFPPVNIGAAVSVRGEWKRDAKWGRQLRAHEYNETAPATQEGIENYLASGLVRGIGPVAAKQIVEYFGKETLQVLNEDPQRLVEVEGIGKKKADMIIKAWQGQREVTSVMLFLQSHNVTTTLATRIYKKYGNDSIAVLRRDPYKLADDMANIGFRTVDKIALQLGFDRQSPTRYRSGLVFILKEQAANEGHCFGTRAGLIREGCKLLGASPEDLDPVITDMVKRGDLVPKSFGGNDKQEASQALFLPLYDMYETQTAYRIQELMAQPTSALRGSISVESAAAAIDRVQQACKVTFDDVQLKAIMTAARGGFTVLTGGPGTGKTTMAHAIIQLFEGEGGKVALAAPTGRAAQRLADGTGLEAKTIHRLLEYSSETKGFGKGPGNLLDCDVLVVDESSMVDIVLMHHLLAALPPSSSIVLVGDVDQLPPVGPGNVLRDIIDSGTVDVVRLERIFRQAEQSHIITNAHRINKGEMPDFKSGGKYSDFFLIEEEDPSRVVELVTDLCVKRLPSHYKVDPIHDIQVLCPMKKGEVGTLHLNTVLQKALNPHNGAIRYGGREFRKGDKVMQVKNNYEKSVFNGGVGTIIDVNTADKSLTISFDANITNHVTYDATEFDQIMLAYAATVHKAQGSEYRIVVAPLLLHQHKIMLQRNLLYTCVTRARDVLVLVGSKAAIAKAVENDKPHARNSLLREKLMTPRGKSLGGARGKKASRSKYGSIDGDRDILLPP